MAPYFTAALIEIFMRGPLMKLNPRWGQGAGRARGYQESGCCYNNNHADG